MCSEFMMVPKEYLRAILVQIQNGGAADQIPDWPIHRADAFLGSNVPIMVPGSQSFEIQDMVWGYERPWLKAPIFNTRADTAMGAHGRTMWRDSLEHRRCVIPTLGFFEFHRKERTVSSRTGRPIKQKFLFTSPFGPLLFVAGIHQDGHFSMMTTEPNACVEQIHSRMPVVLRQDELDLWEGSSYEQVFDRSEFELESKRVV